MNKPTIILVAIVVVLVLTNIYFLMEIQKATMYNANWKQQNSELMDQVRGMDQLNENLRDENQFLQETLDKMMEGEIVMPFEEDPVFWEFNVYNRTYGVLSVTTHLDSHLMSGGTQKPTEGLIEAFNLYVWLDGEGGLTDFRVTKLTIESREVVS